MTAERRTALRTLLLCQGVLVAGLSLSLPFTTLYLHKRGMPLGAVGLCIGLTMLATAAGQGLGGALTDRLGSKPVMAAALAGRSAFVGLMALAAAWSWPPAALVALNAAGGFVGNFYEPAMRAWIAREHPAEERMRAYGLLRVAANAAFAVGPAVGGLMAAFSYALMFAVTSALCAVCLGLLLLVVPPSPEARGESEPLWRGGAVRDRRFLELCALTVLLACAMGQIVAPLSAHASAHAGLAESQVGLLFTLNGAMVVLLQAPAAGLLSGRPLTKAVALGAAFYAVAWSWTGFARGWASLAAGMAIATIGEIIVSPSLQTLTANMAPEHARGRYLGLQGLSSQLGHALGPALGGLGLEHLTGRWTAAPWLAFGALAAAAGAGFLSLGRRLGPGERGETLEVS